MLPGLMSDSGFRASLPRYGVGVFTIGSDKATDQEKTPTDHDRCASGTRPCARADAMFNSDGMHVLDVQQGHRKLVITVEFDAGRDGLPVMRCRADRARPAAGRGRRRPASECRYCWSG